MAYYKYLDLNWQPTATKIKQYIYSNPWTYLTNLKKSSWKEVNLDIIISKVPELLEMVAPLNVTVRQVAFFVSNYSKGGIHIDADLQSKCRLNIPIANCENTETRFYTTADEPILIRQDNGVPLYKINQESCTHVDQYYLTQPVLFRNTQPHQIISNNPNTPRIACTIAFHEDLEYLLN
jgi:hypothetical protein